MNQKYALILASALTVFVLVIVSGLATRLMSSAAAPATDPLADPTVQSVLQAREAEYQRALEQANQQLQTREAEYRRALEQANQQLQQANQQQQPASGQVVQEQAQSAAPAEPAPATPPVAALNAEQAAQAALAAAPGATLTRPPEMVSYQGTIAYEVILDQGTLYIDANNGGVLYNGAKGNETVTGSGPITEQQAAEIATTYLGGGSVAKVEREVERGIEVYVVKFTDGSEVYVTADTGQVAYAEIEGHEGEREEKDHD